MLPIISTLFIESFSYWVKICSRLVNWAFFQGITKLLFFHFAISHIQFRRKLNIEFILLHKMSKICKVGYVVQWVFWELVCMQFPYNGWCSFAVLSVMWSSPKHFIVQTSPEGLFRFEGPGFSTVQELIMHQFHSGLAVTSRSGTILKTPIAREEWELNNDDVQLVEKIGRGIHFFSHFSVFNFIQFSFKKSELIHIFLTIFFSKLRI